MSNGDPKFIKKFLATYLVFFAQFLIVFLILLPLTWAVVKFQSPTGEVRVDFSLLLISLFTLPLLLAVVLGIVELTYINIGRRNDDKET